jgi:PhoH-like ATPase
MTNTERKLFVLDTNILMHDPTAIDHFQEHDIYIPMVVLEELDRHKTGLSEVARNVRQANRMLVALMSGASHAEIVSGLKIPSYNSNQPLSSLLKIYRRHYDARYHL